MVAQVVFPLCMLMISRKLNLQIAREYLASAGYWGNKLVCQTFILSLGRNMDKIATPYIWVRKDLFPLNLFTNLLQSGMAKLSGCHLHCYSALMQISLSDLQRRNMCSLKCIILQAIRLTHAFVCRLWITFGVDTVGVPMQTLLQSSSPDAWKGQLAMRSIRK